MGIQGVIFDLDGTLIQSLPDIAASMNRTLEAYHLPVHPLGAYNTMVGNGAWTLAARAVGARQDLTEAVYKAYRADYAAHTCVLSHPYDGIMDLLQALNRMRMPITVFSNKDHDDVLSVIRHYFPDIGFALLRGRQEGVPLKPAPDGALQIASTLGILPCRTLYVGDTGTDMDCGNRAGMVTVGVTWGFRSREELKEHRACHIVDKPGELLALIDESGDSAAPR